MILALMAGCFVLAGLMAWGLNGLALIPWRRSVGRPWTERARLLYPARKSARINLWLFALAGLVTTLALAPETNLFFAMVPALLGAALGNYPMTRAIYPEVRFKSWLHLVVSSLLLFVGFWAVLLLGMVEMPDRIGLRAWVIAGVVLLVLIAFLSGLGIRLLRGLRLLQPAPERLRALVGEVSQSMGVPVRSTWVLSTQLSNAVALPLTRQLIFTEKLLATHPDEEIKAICAHELGHLNEPRKIILVRTLVALSFFPLVFINPLDSLLGFPDGFLLLLIPLLILLFVGRRVSRRMEKRADQIAVENVHHNPAIYARALERLYETNRMPAVMPRRSNKIHPDLYDRMLAAGVTPDFPKPAPAKGWCWTSLLAPAGFLALLAAVVFIKGLMVVWQTVRMEGIP